MLTVSNTDLERLVLTALSSLSVAYGGTLGTASLPVYRDGQPDPQGPTHPWARLVSIEMDNVTGNTGRSAEGSMGDAVITVNVTSPDVATEANYYAVSLAIDAIKVALRDDQSRTPASGQTQRLRFVQVRGATDPDPDGNDNERTGYVVATAIVDRTAN